jgi:hypothetical protein
VLVGPARQDRLDAAVEALTQLELQEIPFAADAAARLALRRASTSLKLPDCCVLLAAQDGRAEAILTFDDRLGREAQRLGYGPSGTATRRSGRHPVHAIFATEAGASIPAPGDARCSSSSDRLGAGALASPRRT